MLGYQAIGALLGERGTTTVFAMLGGTNVPWLAEGVRGGILRVVKTRHEATAVMAAMGFSQSTGSVGVCTVVRGPGFVNCLDALVTAARNHVPLVLLVAESPTGDPQKSQNIDQRGLSALVGAGFHHVADAAELPGTLVRAFDDARWDGRPQVLSIADPPVLDGEVPLGQAAPTATRPTSSPDAAAVTAAVDALERAERPLILAGQGAVLAGCREELVALAELTGARLAGSLMAAHFFSGHPWDLGLSGGWAGSLARRHLRRADLVLAVGASLNAYTLGGTSTPGTTSGLDGSLFGDAFVIRCDVNPQAHRTSVDLELVGDARDTALALLDEWRSRGLPPPPAPEPVVHRTDLRRAVLEVDLGADPSAGLDPREVYVTLDRALPEDRIVVSDGGRTLPPLPTLLTTRDARSFLVTNGFASIGLGLGAAVGAAVAHPDRRAVLVCGDGGFMMSCGDLDAVRLAGLDLTVVVMNDGQYGAELRHLARHGLPADLIRQSPPDLVALAGVYGGRGAVITDLGTLERELHRPTRGLCLLDVRIDPGVDSRGAVGAAAEAAPVRT